MHVRTLKSTDPCITYSQQVNHRYQTSPALCNPINPFAVDKPHRLRPEIFKILFRKFSPPHRSTLLCSNVVKFVRREICEIVRYLPDQNRQNFGCLSNCHYCADRIQNLPGPAPSNVLTVLRRFHLNRFTFGGVCRTREHRFLPRRVFPLYAWSYASPRANNKSIRTYWTQSVVSRRWVRLYSTLLVDYSSCLTFLKTDVNIIAGMSTPAPTNKQTGLYASPCVGRSRQPWQGSCAGSQTNLLWVIYYGKVRSASS